MVIYSRNNHKAEDDGIARSRPRCNHTGDAISIVGNLQCSNDSIWVSGDSVTITRNTYDTFDLLGCEDYYFYIETLSDSDRITVYLTPYNTK